MRAWTWIAGVALVLSCGPACSAIVDADPDRLAEIDRVDAGGGGTDAGRDAVTPPEDGGVDARPACASGCADGVDCTVDTCVAGVCRHVADDGRCGADARCDLTGGCVGLGCLSDSECDDGRACNGRELCAPMSPGADDNGCVRGAPPSCDDGFDCTTDGCDDGAGCTHAPDHTMCGDGIACTADSCDPELATDETGCVSVEDDSRCVSSYCLTGATCDALAGGCGGGMVRACSDGDPCTSDSCSESGRTCLHALRDDDGDGFGPVSVGGASCSGGTDCDDADPRVHPGATELCNRRDDDCDGMTDESCTPIPDTCATAERIVVTSGGTATVGGSLGDFSPNIDTSCGQTGARDAIYYIDVTAAVDVTIDTIGSTTDTLLAVALDCSAAGFRLGCDDDIDTGVVTTSRIWVHRFGPGAGMTSRRLYILVDGYNSAATGPYTLNVTVSPARADTCGTPIDISGGGSLVGFVSAAAIVGSQTGTCQPAGRRMSPEVVATFTGPADRGARFTAMSDDFDSDLYVRSAPCATGTEMACRAGTGSSMGGYTYWTRLDVGVTPSTRYWLFVDGATAGGAYFVSFEP